MALSIAKVAGAADNVPVNGGAVQVVQSRVTFDSSYPTGGEAVTAANFGLNRILYVLSGVNTAGNRLVVWDDTNSKLKLYTALGTEAADTSDQSTIVAVVTVIGI
jgi:hypothetical protein